MTISSANLDKITIDVEVEKKPEPKQKYDYLHPDYSDYPDSIDHNEITNIFEFIFKNKLENYFVVSVRNQYKAKNMLSKKQIDILRKIYNSN